MRTLQSSRHKKQRSRWARANTPSALRSRTARMRAAKLALPQPCYGYAPGTGWLRITLECDGWASVIDCEPPADTGRKRPRSDQYSVTVDGTPWSQRAGLVAIFDHARSLVPRRLSRDEIAGL